MILLFLYHLTVGRSKFTYTEEETRRRLGWAPRPLCARREKTLLLLPKEGGSSL